MTTIEDIYKAIDSFAPFSTAEGWDNAGLLLGSGGTVVTDVLVALDLTDEILEEARQRHSQLVITHHPVIFDPLRRLDAQHLVYQTVQAGVSVISAHTNLDLAPQGVNQVLAQALGLQDVVPLAPDGLGRVGEIVPPLTARRLAELVKQALGCKGLRYYGATGEISRVAVCGGAGASLLAAAEEAGAQALVTADVKHSAFLEAAHRAITLVDGGHFATENVVVAPLVRRLAEYFPKVTFAQARQSRELCDWI